MNLIFLYLPIAFVFKFKIISYLFYLLIIFFTIDIYLKITPSIDKLKKLNISKKNFISILVPMYNEEKNITKLLDSIFMNNSSNFEVIIINDSSTDNSLKIINKINKYNFKLINLPKQKNVANVLNKGIKFISKKSIFIGVINADCLLSPYCIDNVISRLNWYDINAVNLTNKTIKVNNFNFIEKIAVLEKNFKNFLFTYNESSLNNGYFIKTNIIKKLKGWETITEDLNLNLKLKNNNITIYQDYNNFVYDNIPSTFKNFCKQKFRWVYGDILNRTRFFPKNIFDIIVNIYYFFPLYTLLTIITNTFRNNFIINIQLMMIFSEMLIYVKSIKFNKNKFFDVFIYSLFQFSFHIYFFIKLIISSIFIINFEVEW